jgi:hypothetical protein
VSQAGRLLLILVVPLHGNPSDPSENISPILP